MKLPLHLYERIGRAFGFGIWRYRRLWIDGAYGWRLGLGLHGFLGCDLIWRKGWVGLGGNDYDSPFFYVWNRGDGRLAYRCALAFRVAYSIVL
jgi:hypothetical protein